MPTRNMNKNTATKSQAMSQSIFKKAVAEKVGAVKRAGFSMNNQSNGQNGENC
jgi:hypothetical protein